MTVPTSYRLVCAACGWTPGPPEMDPYPFRCPNAGSDDGDHVITRRRTGLEPVVTSDRAQDVSPAPDARISHNPFVRYRSFLYSWHVALTHGMTDAGYVSLVQRVDAAVARVAGTGFRVTPFTHAGRLSAAMRCEGNGGLWVKDETANVSGSHKARHMMGLALYLEVLREVGIDRDPGRPLAVASCGNAALAAATLAKAIERPIVVFVPEHASATVVARLEALGAEVTRCSRAGLSPSDCGDPCYSAFRRAVEGGALPFSCQGNENGLVIEGCETLAREILDQMDCSSSSPLTAEPSGSSAGPGGVARSLDRLFIQVGGGALASACVRALADAVAEGRLGHLPRIHAVQTAGGHPLKRAYVLLVEHIFERLVRSSPGTRIGFSTDDERARYLLRVAPPVVLDDAFQYMRAHRHEFMWPWATEPRSIAGGILDDETYDWAVVVEAMVRSAGFPIVAEESTLEDANALARDTTGIDVDHTGSSSLAGLMTLAASLARPRRDERVVLLFTGVRRE